MPPNQDHHAPWTTRPLIAFDTETTGVDPLQDRIVTAAIVASPPLRGHGSGAGHPGRTLDQEWLLDPGVEIPAGATAVHGISTQEARSHGIPARQGLEAIATAITAAVESGSLIVVFNATFDLPLLDTELRRHGLPRLGERLPATALNVVDPLVLDRALDRYRPGKRQLGALCQTYGISPDGALHAAAADARATIDLLAAIVEKYPESSEHSPGELMTLQRDAHREWARSLTAYLQRQGSARQGPDEQWL